MSLKKGNYNVDRRLSRRLTFKYTATAVARTKDNFRKVEYCSAESNTLHLRREKQNWAETAEQYSTFLKFVLNAGIVADVAGPASHVP